MIVNRLMNKLQPLLLKYWSPVNTFTIACRVPPQTNRLSSLSTKPSPILNPCIKTNSSFNPCTLTHPFCKCLNPPVVLFLLFLLSEFNIGACDNSVDDHIGAYDDSVDDHTGTC